MLLTPGLGAREVNSPQTAMTPGDDTTFPNQDSTMLPGWQLSITPQRTIQLLQLEDRPQAGPPNPMANSGEGIMAA